MKSGFAGLTSWGREASVPPATALDERIYAIGDVHGRMDLFAKLLGQIHKDGKRRESRPSTIVILGDMIDRGPCSREMLELVQRHQQLSGAIVALRGNHEDMLLKSVEGNALMQRVWLANGGCATLRSYGVNVLQLANLSTAERANVMAEAIGEKTLAWLRQLPLTYRSGDYFFCHAGVRPGVALAKQRPQDLMWIRDEFLSSERDHGAVVVHGHSEATRAGDFGNRINVDTGAHTTGVLSAVGLEGKSRWFLATEEAAPQCRWSDVPTAPVYARA